MDIDTTDPLYLGMSLTDWEGVRRTGHFFGHAEMTNSMRIANEQGAEFARKHPSGKAIVAKINTEHLIRDHGHPDAFRDERHREGESSFHFVKNCIENFIRYVVGYYSVEDTCHDDNTDPAY